MFPHGVLKPTVEHLYFKLLIVGCISLLIIQLLFIERPLSGRSIHIPTDDNHSPRISSFFPYGSNQCIPEISQELIQESIAKHAVCRKYSPFVARRVRIATATAHFGKHEEHYQRALRTHLLHSLMQGTEVHVMCDPIVDDLWNKPAFLLNLLMHEMLKPKDKRLEWIMWVDRDTLVLDQCRPMSSFLPPEPSPWIEQQQRSENDSRGTTGNTTNLLVNNDLNGLNNGVFLIRVNSWAIELFNTILAFRYYKPDVELKFTEQSAMEKVIGDERFSAHVRTVPQYWFNCYPYGLPEHFRERSNETGLGKEHMRRGDYLLHFAGNTKKDEAINGWLDMLQELPDVWEHKTVQRDVSEEVMDLWERLGD